MKIKLKIEKEYEVQTLIVIAEVRYWEDATVNGIEDTEGDLIPFRNGENWCPIIDIDSGVILKWPVGTTADIHYKCNDGIYKLIHKAIKLLK